MKHSKESAQKQEALNTKMVLEAIDRYLGRRFVEGQIEKLGVAEKKRKKLPSVMVIYLLICQSLFRDSNREEVLRKMVEGYQIRGWRLKKTELAGASGISKSMRRVGSQIMKNIFQAQVAQTKPCKSSYYKGYGLKAYDGSCFNLEDTFENQQKFGRPTSEGQHSNSAWPQMRILMEVDVGTRQPLGIAYGGYKRSEKEMMLELLEDKDLTGTLTLVDRGLGWCRYFDEIEQRGGKYLAHTTIRQKIKVLERLPDGSYLGLMKDKENKVKVLVRVVEYRIVNAKRGDPKEVHRLVTNLLDWKKCPAMELIDLYHQRWEIEISFDELKTHLFDRNKMVSFFRSRCQQGVIQELYGMLALYSVIRSLMQEAAEKYDLEARQLSFTDCVHTLRRCVVRMKAARAEILGQIYEQMLDEMASSLLPARRDRINPRVVKKPYSKYKPKRANHRGFKPMETSFLQDVEVRACA